MTQRRIYIWSA